MKVSINCRVQSGPWGGGNRFVQALRDALEANGHKVESQLSETDIDLILLIDPRLRNPAVTFGPGAISRYLMTSNPRALVVHRINECDERKGGSGMNNLLSRANYIADHTIFVGGWLRRDISVWSGKSTDDSSVILNGADTSVFHASGGAALRDGEPLRLVTHHWGSNWMKGFDIYEQLDEMLCDPEWSRRISFTYIGNLPPGFRFKNADYRPPMNGADLAAALRENHAYVTGSICEPGSNHQNEGALCGLPLLFRESGALPEYCDGFGIGFTGPEDFVAALRRMLDEYPRWKERMPSYPHTSQRMTSAYLQLFETLLSNRERIVGARRLWRDPWVLARNQVAI